MDDEDLPSTCGSLLWRGGTFDNDGDDDDDGDDDGDDNDDDCVEVIR